MKKETEIWNESGDSFIWVKVTQVDNSATDYIWTYYNCSDTNSDDATNVWDNNYVGVWHLNETSGLTYDSTSYNNDGSPIGSPNQDFTAGKIDGADDFSGVSQYTTISDTSVLDMSSSFAIEVWVYSDGTQNAYAGVVAKDQAGNFGNYGFFFDAAGTTLRFGFYDTGSAQKEVDTQGAIPTTQWVHFAGVFNDSGDFLEIYQDGVSKEKDATISTTPAANANNLTFASRIAGLTTYEFDGKIDEVRISNTTRSVSWINASYLSGKDQFITYGGSAEQYSAGSSSNYNSPIDINLTDGETWSNFTWQNSSISAGTIIAWKIYANDTSGNENVTEGTFTIQSSWLEVSLITPTAGSNTNVAQNSTFTVNATVYCRGCSCGNVNGTVRYNGSSSNPDTQINTTTGDKPFYIDETSPKAMKECPTNPLSQDEFCNITWTVNATGTQNSVWKIGVLFNSSISGIDDNHTNNATITITEEQESIKLSWTKITFPNLAPSTAGNNATNNNIGGYNITNDGTCTLQTWINGTDLTNQSITPVPSTIGVGNISYSNSTNDYASSTRMTTSYALIGASHTADTNITTYYWFDVPSIYAGNYTGNVTICGNCTSIC